MKWLRSEPMEYISLIVNEDAAHDCIQKLGCLGAIQFTDLNHELTPFQRRYVNYVRRCDEMERKIRYMENELNKFNIILKSAGTIDTFISESTDLRYGSKDTAIRALDTLEHILDDKEQELVQLNQMHEKLTKEYNERKELQEVIIKAVEFFSLDLPDINTIRESRTSRASFSPVINDIKINNNKIDPLKNQLNNDENILKFRNLTGVVPVEDRLKFERMIFRSTRGNCYTRFLPIQEPLIDPLTGESIEKIAFIIFFQSTFMENKLRKICDAFHARLYTLPSIENDKNSIGLLLTSNNLELQQSETILRKNRESCILLCCELADHLQAWKWTILQEKATYHTLNMFKSDVTGMLRGEGWVIKAALEDVHFQVTKAHNNPDNTSMPSLVDYCRRGNALSPTPPTYFQTNKFTESYQSFVDTYGVPRYGEINPAVFTAVTFPFLFGVMYGDIGHGFCLFLAGLYMVLTEKKVYGNQSKAGEMTLQLYSGRYMILMMGLFAVYAGFVYNDFFALSLNLFGSKFTWAECGDHSSNSTHFGICYAKYIIGNKKSEIVNTNVQDGNNVYSFGLDPIWKTSENELLFFNSFKMKLSVIVGIIQMTFGILLKGWNSLYYKKYEDFFFEFIPQIIFSSSLFMYMVVLIIMKWSIDWASRMKTKTCEIIFSDKTTGCRPPSLINTLISIALKPFEIEDPMYDGQLKMQQLLLLLAFISIPILLCAKPFYLKYKHNKHKQEKDKHGDLHENEYIENNKNINEHGNEHEFEFGEIFIHQAIETIEFVLGMVSNTASYLRLWALSLAHSELATVFWDKAMLSTINTNNFFYVFIGFAVFAVTTTGVLLLMDVLECFLHALRLHWVEFQNKFYNADGLHFKPFCFKQILKNWN